MTDKTKARSLIAIGAAAQIETLDDLIDAGSPPFERILLLDPESKGVSRLERHFAGDARVEICRAYVGASEDSIDLHRFNAPGLVSPHAPTSALYRLWPGLQVKARVKTPSLPVAHLVEELAPAPGSLSLVLDAPGDEFGVLLAWQETGALARTAQIVVRCETEVLFHGATTRAEVQGWLQRQGFDLTDWDGADPDWPVLRFEARPPRVVDAASEQAGEIETLKGQVAARDHELSEAAAARAALEAQIAEQAKEIEMLQTRVTARDQELSGLREKLTQQQGDLSLTLQMQAVAQADLQMLRDKYQALQQTNTRQENLLRQLNQRLHQAAGHLRTLSQTPPEEAGALPRRTATPRKKTSRVKKAEQDAK